MQALAVPFREFLAGTTQQKLADQLGVKQGSVSRMLHSKRNLFVSRRENGELYVFEVREVPARQSAA